jgi:hypothetical protein
MSLSNAYHDHKGALYSRQIRPEHPDRSSILFATEARCDRHPVVTRRTAVASPISTRLRGSHSPEAHGNQSTGATGPLRLRTSELSSARISSLWQFIASAPGRRNRAPARVSTAALCCERRAAQAKPSWASVSSCSSAPNRWYRAGERPGNTRSSLELNSTRRAFDPIGRAFATHAVHDADFPSCRTIKVSRAARPSPNF